MSERRILFLGQAPLGEACFRSLLDAESRNLVVVAACSNANANDNWWQSAEIASVARELMPFIPNDRRHFRELEEMMVTTGVNCIVSVQHPWRLPESILRMVNYEAFNLHNGPLPEYGGYNAPSHAILDGALTSGATLHWMADVVDAGPIAFLESFTIGRNDSAVAVYDSTVAAGIRAFSQLIEYLTAGQPLPRRAMVGPVRFHGRAELGRHRQISNGNDMEEVDRKARAFWFPPFEPAYILTATGSKFYVCPATAWHRPVWTKFREHLAIPTAPASSGL